jgi:hypothetical protein
MEIFNFELNDELGVVYENTNVFPKVYYLLSNKKWVVQKLRNRFTLIETVLPTGLMGSKKCHALGNKNLFEVAQP